MWIFLRLYCGRCLYPKVMHVEHFCAFCFYFKEGLKEKSKSWVRFGMPVIAVDMEMLGG